MVCLFLAAAKEAMSAQATNAARIDALFTKWDKPGSPGCAVGVIKEGVFVHARGYGMANLEHGIPITPTTVFDIGSCSKQFTAFSVLLLAHERKLSLDDNIRKYLPEVPDHGRTISIRHLLHHTSGLRDYNDLLELDGKRVEDVTTEEDALRVVAKQRGVNFAAGARYLYSNTGYFLLAVIVKRVGEESLREFARKRIFDPLGMSHTHFHDRHTEIVPSRATGYEAGPGREFGISMSNWEQLGDGALMTTLEDLLKWDRNFYDAKVGGREVIEQMLIPGKLNDGTKLNYACGLIIGEYEGGAMIHHGGAWAGYRAQITRFPERKLSVVLLGNLSSLDAWDLAGRVSLVYLDRGPTTNENAERAVQPAKPDRPARPPAEYTGVYVNPDHRIRRIETTNGNLVLVAHGFARELSPVGEDRFIVSGLPTRVEVEFIRRGRGGPEIAITEERKKPVTWNRMKPKPLTVDWSNYAGTYRSADLTIAYVMKFSGEKLVMEAAGLSQPLTAEFEDGFATGSGTTIWFTRDKGKRVAGFTLSTGRANGIVFRRASVATGGSMDD